MRTEKEELNDLKGLIVGISCLAFLVVIMAISWLGISWGIRRIPDKVRFTYTYVHAIYVFVGNKTGAFEDWKKTVTDRENDRREKLKIKSTSLVGIDPDVLGAGARSRIGMNAGIIVKQVARGSPAFLENVFPGDTLLAVGNNSVSSLDDYDYLLDKYEGQTTSFLLDRNGKRLVKNISIGKIILWRNE